jgi:hypothetical protein
MRFLNLEEVDLSAFLMLFVKLKDMLLLLFTSSNMTQIVFVDSYIVI